MTLSTEQYKTVKPDSITNEELNFLKTFQDFVSLLYWGLTNKDTRVKDIASYKKLKREISEYQDYKFSSPVIKAIKAKDSEIIDALQSQRQQRKGQLDIRGQHDQIAQLLKQDNYEEAFKLASEVRKKFAAKQKATKGKEDIVQTLKNPLYLEDPMFFVPATFIRKFEAEDMKNLIEKDLSTYHYSYLSLPERRTDNFQYLVYYIQELRSDDSEIELNSKQFEKYTEFLFDSPEFEELKRKVDSYLSNNERSLIPDILEGIESFDELDAANEARKSEITEVYRGVPISEGATKEQIIQQDKEMKYVATTTDKRAAERFAKQIGHLEDPNQPRSEEGAIITYKVGPKSIILDTNIFGGIFMEDEVLIDARYAEVSKVDMRNFMDEIEGNDLDESTAETDVYKVKLDELQKVLRDPFKNPIWTNKPISKDLVKKFIEKGTTEPRPSPDIPGNAPEDTQSRRSFHAKRIAHLVENSDDHPIILNTMTHSVDIEDGWHRYAAALYRGDKDIKVLFEGYEDNFHDIFPNAWKVSHTLKEV